MTLYLGTVSCDLHKCAACVRVSIPGTDGIPLSVKAVLGNYPRHLFKRNVTVEVEQAQHDGRMFRVTRVFEAMKKPVTIARNFNIPVPDAETLKKEQAMAMSKDRVRFYIGHRYFDQTRELCTILRKAFDMSTSESEKLINSGEGFWITCRPSQFARFMIYRNAAGITNGFMDLKAELINAPNDENYYSILSRQLDIPRSTVKKVVLALGYGHEWVAERLSNLNVVNEVNVSDR